MKSKIVFRNFDKKAIRSLLNEIGKERYEAALQDAEFTNKPLSLEGFFVQYQIDNGDIDLYFMFPMCKPKYLMPVLGFWAVPKTGWEMKRIDIE